MVAVPSKRLGHVGLLFGFTGMQTLILGIWRGFSAGDIAFLVVLFQTVHYCNGRAIEQANNSQNSGNVKHTDSLVYAQIV